MDETPVWLNMVSDTAVDKTGVGQVTMKSTGQGKCWVSVCLPAKVNRSKFKPYNVFKNAKCETKTLNDAFKTCCVIVNSSDGWMNNLTIEYTQKVLGTSSFGRRFLAWDSCKWNVGSYVVASLTSFNIDQAIIPGACTSLFKCLVFYGISLLRQCKQRDMISDLQKKE